MIFFFQVAVDSVPAELVARRTACGVETIVNAHSRAACSERIVSQTDTLLVKSFFSYLRLCDILKRA